MSKLKKMITGFSSKESFLICSKMRRIICNFTFNKMQIYFKKITLLLFFVLLTKTGLAQFYQGSYQEFGKNRVQYNSFAWKSHNYTRFKIYYSGINEELAIYTARTLHNYLSIAETKLDFTISEKLEVIVYQSQSKFRQSNLGLSSESEANIGGSTRIVGSKIFVYYEGDHQKFNENIKAAVYEVLLKQLFYGGDWKDQLKSSVSSGIPTWLEEGLIRYFVKEWDENTESRVKDLILTKKLDTFNNLSNEDKRYAGHAVWNYISESHGPTIIPNILYVTRISKNVERGFFSLLGLDFTKLTRNYIAFYRARYIKEYETQKEPIGQNSGIKHKKEADYYGVKINPNGDEIAYVENQLGRYRVKTYHTITKKTNTIFAAEPKLERIQDHSYPVLDWHPSGEGIAFFSELKGELILFIYDRTTKKTVKKRIKNLDKVLDFSYSPDGKFMIISAVVKGQTDLYVYDVLGNTMKQITDDIYDDLNPRYTDKGQNVIFVSNRNTDTIFKKPEIEFSDRQNDIYLMRLKDVGKTYIFLDRITNTSEINESQPYQLKSGEYVFLSDKNGLNNRFIAEKDSVISFIDTIIHYRKIVTTAPQTDYVTSINNHHINKNMDMVYSIYQNGKHKFLIDKATTAKIDVIWNTTYIEKRIKRKEKLSKQNEIVNDTLKVGNHLYQKEVVYIGGSYTEEKPTGQDTNERKAIEAAKFSPPNYLIYKINFAKDYLLSQLDNNFLFPNYQPYSGPGSIYFNPGVNALLKIGASDLFDDYKILGGVRFGTQLNNGGELLLMIQHLKNRIDHRLVFYRQKSISGATSKLVKFLTHDIRYRLSFPISEVLSVRGNLNIRKDNKVFIPLDDISLSRQPEASYNSGLNLELVLDNTIPIELNIRRGTQFKLFAEYLQELGGNFDPTFNLGLDLRHSMRIKRNFVWVNRLAGSTSLGGRKLVYYMGGVDNWILRPDVAFDQTIDVDPSQNFGFQTIATPIRGFIQNARNGNSFVSINSEFRLPVFSFFSPFPIKSDFLRHFQLMAFGDVGAAWTGPHPFHPDNYFNSQTINDKPVVINVVNLREPIIGGIGLGVRSKIWGYFVRLDLAWGIENLIIQKPLPYISLSKDI